MSEIPVIPADSFAAFRDLLALLASEKRTTRTLNSLEDRLAQVAAAESKLEAARAAHEQTVAKDCAELEDKAAKLRAKEFALIGREQISEKIVERDRADRLSRARPLSAAATISREQP